MLDYLYLIKNIDFSKDYEHVITFKDLSEQRAFFLNKDKSRKIELRKIRVINGIGEFKISFPLEELQDFSYIMWDTVDIKNNPKTMYAFIDDITYVQQDVSLIKFTVDVWNTYQFDYEIVDSFVKREHQNRFDSNGKPIFNTNVEDIELGENYSIVGSEIIDEENKNLLIGGVSPNWLYVVTIEPLNDSEHSADYGVYSKTNEINLGVRRYCFPLSHTKITTKLSDGGGTNAFPVIRNNSKEYQELITNPKVIASYITPYGPELQSVEDMYDSSGVYQSTRIVLKRHYPVTITGAEGYMFLDVDKHLTTFKLPSLIDELQVYNYKNILSEPKLLTEPYTLFDFTNHVSEPYRLNIKDIQINNEVNFYESLGIKYGSLINGNNDDSKMFKSQRSEKNVDVPLLTDKYVNYVYNSKASSMSGIALGTTGIGIGIGTGFLSPSPFMKARAIGSVVTGTTQIINEVSKISDLKSSPLSVKDIGNNSELDIMLGSAFLLDRFRFHLYTRKVNDFYYKRAFEYFYRYGYSALEHKIPNLKSRDTFNYIECVDVQLSGNINSEQREKLRNILKNGVTLWHYKDNFKMYDYSTANNERS